MTSTWRLLFGLMLVWSLVNCQDDLELDYSNEYDDVRPHLTYPDDPRLENRIASAGQQFAENMKNAWQSMVDSFNNFFGELRDVLSNNSTKEFPTSN